MRSAARACLGPWAAAGPGARAAQFNPAPLDGNRIRKCSCPPRARNQTFRLAFIDNRYFSIRPIDGTWARCRCEMRLTDAPGTEPSTYT
jgi:hypothetical protein